MYGFTPSATTEKLDRPPPDSRSSTPKRALFCEVLRELGLVDARDRHVGQEPEDDQDPEDVEQPAPDVRRPEGVQQRVEHRSLRAFVAGRSAAVGAGVVAGDRLAASARRRRRRARRPARPAGASVGGVGASATSAARPSIGSARRPAVGLGGLGVGRRRPAARGSASLAFFGLSGLAAFSAATAAASPARRRPRRSRAGHGRRPCGRRRHGRRRSARRAASARSRRRRRPGRAPAADSVGISRTLTVPPAASIFVVADFV